MYHLSQCFDSKLFQICTCNFLRESQVGVLDGQGFSVNIPWSRGGVGDNDYIFAFQTVVLPIGNNKIALRCVLFLCALSSRRSGIFHLVRKTRNSNLSNWNAAFFASYGWCFFFLMGEKTCLLIALEPFDLHAFMDSYFCNIVPQLSYCFYYYCCCESCICAAAEFAADITIISAGFDAARGDPLGGCDVRFLLILIAKL